MPKDNLQKLYENAKTHFSLPDFETFKVDMEDEGKRKRMYESASEYYDLPDFGTFSKDMGFGSVNAPKKKEESVSVGGQELQTPSDASSIQTQEKQSSGDIPTVTMNEEGEIFPSAKDIDVKSITDALVHVPEKYLMDKNFADVFSATYAKKRGVNPETVKQVVRNQQDEQKILQFEEGFRRTGDPAYMIAISDLHKKLGREDVAQQAMSKAEQALPTIGNGDYHQPQYTPTTHYKESDLKLTGGFFDDALKKATVGFFPKSQGFTIDGGNVIYDSEPTSASRYLTDIAKANEAFSVTGAMDAYNHYVIDPSLHMITSGYNKRKESAKIGGGLGLLHETVGNGEMLLGALGLLPAGQMFMGAFTAATEHIPHAAEVAMPVTSAMNYFKARGVQPPIWAEDVAALVDFAWMAKATHGVMGAAKEAKNIKRSWDMNKILNELDPTEVKRIEDQVTAKYKQYEGKPSEYHQFVMDKIAEGVDSAKAEIKADEPYVPEEPVSELSKVKLGSDVEYQGKQGTLDRADDGAWIFTEAETGASVELPVKDKVNPTESLNELGLNVLPEVSSENIAKALADKEQVGQVDYNGKKYMVSLGNKMNPNDTVGDVVYEVLPDGRMVNRFDNHADPTFAANRKLAIINAYMDSVGLPRRQSLHEPWREVGEGVEMENLPKRKAEEVTKVETEEPVAINIDTAEVSRQMKPITDEMANIEMEFKDKGYDIDWDYDNEIIITDKDGEIVGDPSDLPSELAERAAAYEQATSKLGEYDHEAYYNALEASRESVRGKEVEYEDVTEATAKALDGEAPTKENVTERLNIGNPFYKKVEDALVKLGLIEKYNPETGLGDVVGGYVQPMSDGGISAGKLMFNKDGSISYLDGNVRVSFDKNGNVISENTKEASVKEKENKINGQKESIALLEKTRDSENFKYKKVTETDRFGNRKKVIRLKTAQELKESTDKINVAIDKAKSQLAALEGKEEAPKPNESATAKTNESVENTQQKERLERERKEELKNVKPTDVPNEISNFPLLKGTDVVRYIPESLAQKVWEVWDKEYQTKQSLERVKQRGGFGINEMDMFYPTWRNELPESKEIKARYDAELDALNKSEPIGQQAAALIEAKGEGVSEGVSEGVTKPEPVESPKDKMLRDIKRYNEVPKRDKQTIGAKLKAKIMEQAKELGYDIRIEKDQKLGAYTAENKKIKRAGEKRPEEEIQAEKELTQKRRNLVHEEPNSLESFILQQVLGGTVLSKAWIDRYTGLNANDFPPFIIGEKGMSFHDIWENSKEEYPHLIPESDFDFANAVADFITEHESKDSMYRRLEELQRGSKDPQELYWESLTPEEQKIALEDSEKKMIDDEVDNLTDEQVEQQLKDLYDNHQELFQHDTTTEEGAAEAPKSKTISPEEEERERRLKQAENRVSEAKSLLEAKRKELDESIIADQENLFGERKSSEGVTFDQRVEADKRADAIAPLERDLSAAQAEYKALLQQEVQGTGDLFAPLEAKAEKLEKTKGSPKEVADARAEAANIRNAIEGENTPKDLKGIDRAKNAVGNLKDLLGNIHDAEQADLLGKIGKILGEQRASMNPIDKLLEAAPIFGKLIKNYVAKGVKLSPEIVRNIADFATGLIEEGATTYGEVMKYLSEKMGIDESVLKPYEGDIKNQIEYENNVAPIKFAAQKAVTETERLRLGLSSEVMKDANQRGMGETFKEAQLLIDRGLNPADRIEEILAQGKNAKINDLDVALIDLHIMNIKLKLSALDKMLKEARTHDQWDLINAKYPELEHQLARALDASDVKGSIWGRTGVAMQMMLKEDYSVERIMSRAMRANGGKYPTGAEVAKIRELSAQIEALSKELADNNAKWEAEFAKINAGEVVKAATRKARRVTNKAILKEERKNIFADIRKDIRESMKGASMNAPSQLLPLANNIGKLLRNYVEDGITDLSQIVDDLYMEFKDDIKGLSKDQIIHVISGDYAEKRVRSVQAGENEIARLRREARDAWTPARAAEKAYKEAEEAKKQAEAEQKKFLAEVGRMKADAAKREAEAARKAAKVAEARYAAEQKKAYKESEEYKAKKREEQLDAQINKVRKQLSELQNGTYVPPPVTVPKITNSTIQTKEQQLGRLKRFVDAEIEAIKLKDIGGELWHEKIARWQRMGLLSRVATIGKLSAAALGRIALSPIEAGVSFGLSYLPVVSQVAAQSPRYGRTAMVKSELSAMKMFIEKATLEQMKQIAKTGMSDLDIDFGGKKIRVDKHWMEFNGRLHGLLKYPAKINEFYRSYERRYALELQRSGFVDAAKRYEIGVEAYNDANRSIFMGNNIVNDLYKELIQAAERKNYRGAKSALNMLFPIVKVPTNYVKEIGSYTVGAPIATLEIFKHLMFGELNKLSPKQADHLMRNLTKGTVGVLLWQVGWNNPDVFGGYYSQKYNKKGYGDAPVGDIRVNINGSEYTIPHLAAHLPLIEVMQMAATMRRIFDDLQAKGNVDWVEDALVGVNGGIGQMIPFAETPARITDAFMRGRQRPSEYAGEYVANMFVPGIVQEVGKWIDPAESRKAHNFQEAIQKSIPVLREQLGADIKTELGLPEKDYEDIAKSGAFDNVQPYYKKTIVLIKGNNKFEPHYMSDKEVLDINKRRNKYVSEWLKEGMDKSISDPKFPYGNFRGMSDVEKKAYVKVMFRVATIYAKNDIFGENKWINKDPNQ